MVTTRSNTHQTGMLAMQLVEKEITKKGAKAVQIQGEKKHLLKASSLDNTHRITIRVKSRASGDFQISTREARKGNEPQEVKEYWILVDLTVSQTEPDFYIMPDWWIRNNIYTYYQNWLKSHGGVRPVTPQSDHHRVTLDRIVKWKDRWDILGIF